MTPSFAGINALRTDVALHSISSGADLIAVATVKRASALATIVLAHPAVTIWTLTEIATSGRKIAVPKILLMSIVTDL